MAIHIRVLVLSDYLESVEKAITDSLGYLTQKGKVQLADRDEDASAKRIRLVDFPESDVEISFRSNSPDRTTIPNVLADIESGRFDTLYDLVLIDDRWGKNEYGGQDLLMEPVYRHVQGLVDELPLVVLYTRHWETDRLNRFFNRVRERGLDSNRLVPCRKEDFGQFLQILFRVLSTKRMAREKRQAQCESEETLAVLRTLGCKLEDTPQSHPNIIGNSIQMRALFALIERYAQSGSNVLITGETGTGKELFARALHDASPRKNAPYFAFNSAGLTDTLAESELFGHEQGAFTDAVTRHIGYFELADDGTIFMDEIGDMSPRIQAKLLRVLEDGTYRRVGGTVPLACNVRIISATNKNIRDLVEKNFFATISITGSPNWSWNYRHFVNGKAIFARLSII